MKLKDGLEKRIRGWFPSEPNLAMCLQQTSQAPQTTLDQKTMVSLGATQQRPLLFIITPIVLLGGSYFISRMFIETFAVLYSDFFSIALLSGLIVGSLTNYFVMRWQLRLLAKKGETSRSRKFNILTRIALIALSEVAIFVPVLFRIRFEMFALYMIFWVAAFIGYMTPWLILSFRWETLNKKRIYQGRSGKVYAIPKNETPPESPGNKWKRVILDFFY